MSNLCAANKQKDLLRDAQREARIEKFTEESFTEMFKDMVPKRQEEVESVDEEEENNSEDIPEDQIEIIAPQNGTPFNTLTTFEDPLLCESVRKAARMMNLVKPTTIQKYSSLILTSHSDRSRWLRHHFNCEDRIRKDPCFYDPLHHESDADERKVLSTRFWANVFWRAASSSFGAD